MSLNAILNNPQWVAKVHKYTFDAPKGKNVGHVIKGNWLGDYIGKVKDPNTDSYWYEFRYPTGSLGIAPDTNTYGFGMSFFLLAEPDEVEQKLLKAVGGDLAKKIEKIGQGAEDVFSKVAKLLFVAFIIYFGFQILINRLSR